ncbi:MULTISPECIES: rhodanese-like domain-containing protein [unclassified Arthrobacter]|uniref:rhodanese-like domain-containing protein n=1 Tax=unclassified Arthrobacter TaxID=235627 RepID=UPI00159EA69C|nr:MULTISPECIES: rhodanese-like domain-containing protein [unclassified Arthrobacter]MCQ9164778.1 rhodanese-like domain-containing protein [Arthrobacter sp. STN4]NVM98774.1 rhodanese-like domain-containing protein [Arthrobacter sp. SDTb3-6]
MSYAGDLAPAQAWDKVAAGAVLVDVRTDGEWAHIGVPDLSALDAEPVFIQWSHATGRPNPDFLAELQQAVPAGRELVILCRSGARSIAAAEAATAAGYTAFNVLEGFEGVPDGYGDRIVNGWKNRRLPWK